jgi:hypothetical protein
MGHRDSRATEACNNRNMPSKTRGRAGGQRAEVGAAETAEKFGSAPPKREKRLSYATHRPGKVEPGALVHELPNTARRQVRFDDSEAAPK